MKSLLVALLLAWTTAVLAQTNHVPANVDPQQAITLLREGLIDSFNRADIDHLLTYLDPDVVVVWQNGEVCEGTNAVKAYYERMMKSDHPVVRKISSDPKVTGRHLQGEWAVSWGNLNDDFELTDGRKLPFNSQFTATIARRGDRWLVSAFHASVNVFDNAVLSLAIRKVGLAAGLGGAGVGLVLGFLVARRLRRPKPVTTA